MSSAAAARSAEHRFELTFRTLHRPRDDAGAWSAPDSGSRGARRLRGRAWDERADVWIILARETVGLW